MAFIRKVGGRVAEPGMEWEILRRLPRYWLGATVVPALVAGLNHLFPVSGSATEVLKQTYLLDALAIAAVIAGWTAVLTVAIGCWIVTVMKGPRYEADSYPLNDADRPDPD